MRLAYISHSLINAKFFGHHFREQQIPLEYV